LIGLVKQNCRFGHTQDADIACQALRRRQTPLEIPDQSTAWPLGRPGEALLGPAGEVGTQGDHRAWFLAAGTHQMDAPGTVPVGDEGDGGAIGRPGGQPV